MKCKKTILGTKIILQEMLKEVKYDFNGQIEMQSVQKLISLIIDFQNKHNLPKDDLFEIATQIIKELHIQ
jgi:hypothetical protein